MEKGADGKSSALSLWDDLEGGEPGLFFSLLRSVSHGSADAAGGPILCQRVLYDHLVLPSKPVSRACLSVFFLILRSFVWPPTRAW